MGSARETNAGGRKEAVQAPRRSEPAAEAGAPEVLALQRAAGNRTVDRLLSVAQAKLDVGAAADPFELEADRVARQVVATLQGARAARSAGAGHDHDGHDHAPVGASASIGRRGEVGAAGGRVGTDTEAAINSARGGGRPLEAGTQAAMEGAFGADFSQVRLHAGTRAADLNERIQAKAFTIGHDIFFRGSLPDAGTADGQSLLAHELTHTIQQSGGSALDPAARTHDAGAASRTISEGCCGEIHPDGSVVRRHSSWEHSLLGDAKPDVLAKMGTWQDLINQTNEVQAKRMALALGEAGMVDPTELMGDLSGFDPTKDNIGTVKVPGVGDITKSEVMHVLVQEMKRLKDWQASPPKRVSADEAMKKAEVDPEFQVYTVRLPGKDGLTITYGELNTLADFYGNYDEMAKADPKARFQIVQSVRKETYLRLQDIYEQLKSSLTSEEKKQIKQKAKPGPGKAAEADPTKEYDKLKLGKTLGRQNTRFKGSITPDYISGMAGQIELLKGIQKIGTKGGVNKYGAGLARNACHFVPESWLAWADCHQKAIDLATQSHDSWREVNTLETDLTNLAPGNPKYLTTQQSIETKKQECSDRANQAMLQNGFGDHYLQDSYASGHMINKTQIMQWYVEFIDNSKSFDFTQDKNWRKDQMMAYGQPGLASPGQYDKTKVKGYDPTDQNPNAPRNPQSVENIGGDDWTVRFKALGLQVPHSLTDPKSDERAIFQWWQERASLDSSKRKAKGSDLKRTGLKGLSGTVEAAVANLVYDGVVRTDEGVGKRADYMQERSGIGKKSQFPGMTFYIRDDYVPGKEKLAEIKKAKKKNPADDSGFQKMAQAVTYGDYLEFISSSYIQKATNALHDAFCKNGLWVTNDANVAPFKVYGDDRMFNEGSGEGVKSSGETSNMSRDAIVGIINSRDEGTNTTKAIMDRLPSHVEYEVEGAGKRIDSIKDWHDPSKSDALKDICMTKIFPKMGSIKQGVVQKVAPGMLSPSLGKITRDTGHQKDAF